MKGKGEVRLTWVIQAGPVLTYDAPSCGRSNTVPRKKNRNIPSAWVHLQGENKRSVEVPGNEAIEGRPGGAKAHLGTIF